jgi:small subunit ribosomal protein S6
VSADHTDQHIYEEEGIMALYEHVYLARQDVTPQQVETLNEQFKSVIEAHGGKIAKLEYWGVKSLAYRIKKNRKAHFTLMNIDAPSAALTEMERQMGINEDILRFITLRVDEHEDGPSVMMRKRDDSDREREDRGDRGDRRGGAGGGRGRRSRDDMGYEGEY